MPYISPTCLPYFWSVRSDRPFSRSAFPLIFLFFKFSAILALRHSVGLVGAQHIRNVLSVQCPLPSASAAQEMFLHMFSTSSTATRRGAHLPVDAAHCCPGCSNAQGSMDLQNSSWQAAAAALQRTPGQVVLLHTTKFCLKEKKTHSFA